MAWTWARAGDVVASYVAWAWAGVGMVIGVECHELRLQACTLPCIALVDIATTPLSASTCVLLNNDDDTVVL